MLKKIIRNTITEEVEKNIRILIVDEKLLPGQKINVDLLSREFGTSKVPIREALKSLEKEELVVYKPMNGWNVAEISLQNFKETLEIQSLLEVYIASKIISQIDYSDEYYEKILIKMNKINDNFYEKAKHKEYNRALELNVLFHSSYYSLYNNKSFSYYLNILWNRDLQCRRITTIAEGFIDQFYCEHKEIIKAIKDKNTSVLVKNVSNHFETVISSAELLYNNYIEKIAYESNLNTK